jgi:hypothetical protein
MKRLMQVSFIVILVLVLTFAVLQSAAAPTAMAIAPAVPNVGWNTGVTGFLFGGDAEPNVGWNGKAVGFIVPVIQPCVGWNT